MPVFYRKDMMPMSQFSELLKEYIKKKDITIKALAERCGIDRTYLHKILKGERKVPSVDFVENISLQLMLSTEDKSRLMELYNISEMGEDVYNRRKQVSKIIHDMANTNMEEPDALTFKTEVDIDSVPEISIYTDKRELRKNLQVLICSDVHNGSDIQVIAQPTEFLTNLLSIAAEGSESAINHLFFFDNTSGEKNTAKYNLDIFPFICHLAQKHEKYEAFYYYEGASAYFNSTNIMPNIMITNNFLIRTDSDYCEGVIYRSKPMVEFYMRQFEKFKTKCAKLLDHAVDILEYVYFWYDDNANFIGVDFQPCTMLCLTEDIYNAHALLPADAKKFVKAKLTMGKKALSEHKFVNLFSEKGLAEFMTTGEIFELPRNSYTFPTLAERKIMLQIMISLCENGMADYRIIKNDYFEDIYNAHALLPADAKKFVKAKLTMGKKALSEHKFVNLFSEKGLAEFMTTGEIFELPRNSYTFPTLAERKIMLQIMISLCENGMADYRIIKNDYFAVSKNLCINISDNTSLNIIARNNCFSDFSYLKISETSLVQAFWDYFQHFIDSDAVCSHEETIEILRSYL